MKTNKIANIYAESLLLLAVEKGIAELIRSELNALMGVIQAIPKFSLFFHSPRINQKQKVDLIEKTLANSFSPVVIHFIMLLVRKRRETQLFSIVDAYNYQLDEQSNRIPVEVRSAISLDQNYQNKIKQVISDKLAKEVILSVSTDESLIGGLVIKIGDLVADISVANSLRQIRERIISSDMRSEKIYEN